MTVFIPHFMKIPLKCGDKLFLTLFSLSRDSLETPFKATDDCMENYFNFHVAANKLPSTVITVGKCRLNQPPYHTNTA